MSDLEPIPVLELEFRVAAFGALAYSELEVLTHENDNGGTLMWAPMSYMYLEPEVVGSLTGFRVYDVRRKDGKPPSTT